MSKSLLRACLVLACLGACGALAFSQQVPLRNGSILDSLQSITESTSPSNGDLNPNDVAFVAAGFPAGGSIVPGDVLVSNFNAKSNLEGTGTTIVSISPTGQQSLCNFEPHRPTALGVLSRGYVLVGNVPVRYPKAVSTPGQDALQVFDRNGNHVTTIDDPKLLDTRGI